jgi:putative phosphoribosyl transferase
VTETSILVEARDAELDGDLTVPRSATALVLFAHGSGSSRRSSRNRAVAEVLQAAGLATLLFDLLTPAEEDVDLRTRELRFDIPLLAERLGAASDWAARQPELRSLAPAYFGASTGAAAALVAASERQEVRAIVSRGGRPDLAGDRLPLVQAPTLLVVGSRDETVLDLNRRAAAQMQARLELEIVDGATHLFEEPGALKRVAELARDWFVRFV